METYDGNDIKYLLGKRGYTLRSVARDLDISPTCVNHVIWGRLTSHRVAEHIERLLEMDPGQLKIARASNQKKAA